MTLAPPYQRDKFIASRLSVVDKGENMAFFYDFDVVKLNLVNTENVNGKSFSVFSLE
jgi:hypothetical protein